MNRGRVAQVFVPRHFVSGHGIVRAHHRYAGRASLRFEEVLDEDFVGMRDFDLHAVPARRSR